MKKKLNIKSLTAAMVNRGGGALVGGAAGKAANKVIPASMNPMLRAGIKAAVGAVIPELMPTNKFVDYAGAGMVGQAAGELAESMIPALAETAITGIEGIGSEQEFPIDEDVLSGIEEEGPINGTDDSPISGIDDDDVDLE